MEIVSPKEEPTPRHIITPNSKQMNHIHRMLEIAQMINKEIRVTTFDKRIQLLVVYM